MTKEQLQLSTGPWAVECVEPGAKLSGDHWLIASLGEDYEGRKWYITTHYVRASEYVAEPEADAKAIVAWRNSL
jgi:hypothetical protein